MRKEYSNEKVENYTNLLLLKADIDMDDRLSLSEFINFILKDKELLTIFSGFACLSDEVVDVTCNKQIIIESVKQDRNEEDADLEEEVRKGSEERSEARQKIKEGLEFYTKVDVNSPFKEEIITRTEFTVVKPWKGVMLDSIPTNYEPHNLEGQVSNNFSKYYKSLVITFLATRLNTRT